MMNVEEIPCTDPGCVFCSQHFAATASTQDAELVAAMARFYQEEAGEQERVF